VTNSDINIIKTNNNKDQFLNIAVIFAYNFMSFLFDKQSSPGIHYRGHSITWIYFLFVSYAFNNV